MALVQNFNVNPYYDDYDEDKKFIRMLFRPGYAVQARELTQLQTILQKQIDRFGSHVFRNGSVVTGGEISFSTSVSYLKLETTDSNGNNIDVSNFLNKKLKHTSTATGAVARVVAAIEATDTDPPTLIIQYAVTSLFRQGSSFYTLEDSSFEGRVLNEAGATGPSSVASVSDGVYFIDGIFVKVNAQTIPLEKYSMFATYRIGLAVEESIVTETSDTSLLDPALNASNYQAPGAARYKINLGLEKRTLASTDDTKFFEILRLQNSKIVLHRRYPIYSELERTLARRTFDESGNYTVKPFLISVVNHIPPIGNTANTQLLTASISPGKAYVYGFERETVGPTLIDLKKARTKASVSNYDIETNYGNYLEVSNVKGLFDISTMSTMDLHCVPVDKVNTANTNLISSTKIGTAKIRQIEFVSAANTGNATSYKNNFYIFDTNFLPITGNASAGGNTTAIVLANNGTASTSSNAYSGAIIRITTGLAGDNVKRTITNYDHLTKTATVDASLPFTIGPGANSIYSIDFGVKDLESFVINSSTTLIATANVSDTNKEGTIATGNTFLSDTNFNSLVFKIPENYIAFNMTDQDYRGRKVFKNQTVTAGVLNLSTGSGSEVFVGSGALSDTQKLEHFLVYANNISGAPEFTANQAISFATSTGRSITVSGSTANLSFATGNTFTVDIISTVDFNSPTAKLKTYVSANTTHAVTTGGTTIGSTTVYLASGQVAISSPNKRNGDSDNLYVADIHQLEGNFERSYGAFNITTRGTTRKSSFKVIDSGNPSAAVVTADLTNAAKDITDRYILNTGQKDGYYDHGYITLKPYANPPTGQILVIFNYFTHSGSSGYLTCDSYNVASLSANTDTRYALIPTFTSPATGEVLNLRDCVDFRPIRTNAVTAFTLNGISLTKAEEALESDYSYYLPRQDKIVITQEGKLQILEGISDLSPQSPAEAENAMTLYKALILPFTFFPTDVKLTYVENKRYTMRDIGRLEKRIENVEYYTTLNTLEKSAQDLTILDANGLERFKNGIVVDSFRGHQVGDVKNIDYTCSMNYETGELRPYFTSNSISFVVDSASTTANSYMANTVITVPYTSSSFITQNVATNSLAVNPFNLTFYAGTIDLFPASDVWIDTETRPDVLVNLEGENDNWEAITAANADPRNFGFGTQWGDWNTYVTGQSVEETRRTEENVRGGVRYADTISRTVTTTNYGKSRHGTTQIIVPERIQQSIGKRQVDLSIIPYMRAKRILFGAKNLKPNKFAYTFFDDLPVNRFIEIPSIVETTNISSTLFRTLETVTSTSGGTGTMMIHVGRSYGANNSFLYLSGVRGTIAANDTITGSESGATAFVNQVLWNHGNVVTANASTITLGSAAPYTNWYTDIGNTINSVSWANPRDWYAHPNRANTAKNYSEAYGYDQIRIVSGTGAGQVRFITNYNGSTKIATLNANWDVIPDETSVWSVRYPMADDFGNFVGAFHLPNLNASTYLDEFKFKVGSKIFKVTDNRQNDPLYATMTATAAYHAQGILNTVEDVSVSVRVPTTATSVVFEEASAGSTYAVNDSTVQSQVIGYIYEPPPGDGGDGGDGSYTYLPPSEVTPTYEPSVPSTEISFEGSREDDSPATCPTSDMRILMSDKTMKRAEDLQIDDEVYTQHEETLKWGNYKVTYVNVVDSKILTLIFDNTKLVCSPSHKLYVDNKGWTKVKLMEIGDVVSGNILLSITEEEKDDKVVIIKVNDAHTYICEGLLSHNKSPSVTDDPVGPPGPGPDITYDNGPGQIGDGGGTDSGCGTDTGSCDSGTASDSGGGGGGECFTADTLITLHDGTYKLISEIKMGDLVKDALTGKPNKVIGVKTTRYEVGRRLFATEPGVKPFITEQHAFYNDKDELCAMSEECEYLAPWLGKVNVVSVPEIEVNESVQTVYNLMFESGNSHYANGVRVSNMVGTGNLYVLVMKGFLDKESYLAYTYHLENTVGLNALTQEQKAKVFFVVRWIGDYVLHHDNLRSRYLAKLVALAVRNRNTLYPWLEKWFKSRLRNWLFGGKK